MKTVGCILVVLLVPSLEAATNFWHGSSDGNWSNGANWTAGTAPLPGDDLVFPPGAARFNTTNNFLPGPRGVRSVVFTGSGYRLFGNLLRLTNGMRAQNLTGANTVNCPIELLSSATIANDGLTSSLLDINGDIHLGAHTLSVTADNGELYLSGVISGAGGLTTVGLGMVSQGAVRLDGPTANTYAGTTRAIGSRLELNKGAGGGVIAVPGDLVVGTSSSGLNPVVLMRDDQLSSSSDVTVEPSGWFSLQGFSTPIGALIIKEGAMVQAGSSTTGSVLTLNGDVMASGGWIGGVLSLGSVTRIFSVTTVDGLFINGRIIGSGGIIKTGAGPLTFEGGPNTYNGLTTVREGTLSLQHADLLGTTTFGTVVESGATLVVGENEDPVDIGLEPLTLEGGQLWSLAALDTSDHTNSWAGLVFLASNSVIYVDAGAFDLTGLIRGPGGLTKIGPGTLMFSGAESNTYAGPTRVHEGTLHLARSFFDRAIPGDLFIGDGLGGSLSDVVRIEHFAQINNLAAVTIASSGLLDLNGISETVGSLAGLGRVQVGPNNLGVGVNGTSTSFGGQIVGTGALTKMGLGALTLNGSSVNTGTTLVTDGILMVSGTQARSPVNVTGGILGGDGVVGSVILSGDLAPGSSPGVLSCSNLNCSSVADLFFELNGDLPGHGYDQLNIRGGILLDSPALHASLGFDADHHQSFTILINDGSDPVQGTFSGLAEGASLAVNGTLFQITYRGGDGNDVVLTRIAAPAARLTAVTSLPHGQKRLSGAGLTGLLYTLEGATNLNAPITWTVIGRQEAGPGGFFDLVDTNAPFFRQRFYRALSP